MSRSASLGGLPGIGSHAFSQRCLSPAVTFTSTAASAPSAELTFTEGFLGDSHCAHHADNHVTCVNSFNPIGGLYVVYFMPILHMGNQGTNRWAHRLKVTQSCSVQTPEADSSRPLLIIYFKERLTTQAMCGC